jgi:hypothetical protein
VETQAQKGGFKKRAAAVTAVVLTMAIMAGGTYMWRDYRQHKTNEAAGKSPAYDVRLVEDFKEVPDWKTTDPPVKKQVRVANVGKVADGFSNVYVRLQLKEYMEIAPLTYTQTNVRYLIDHDTNHFFHFESDEAAETAYPGHTYAQLTDAVTGDTGWFVQSQAHDPDGQYGKFVVTDIVRGAAQSLVPGVARAPEAATADHQIQPNGECAYTVHTWNGTPDGSSFDGRTMFPELMDTVPNLGALTFHDFVRWTLGEDVIPLSAFIANGSEPGAKWVYDDRLGGTNWVYWGQALEPQNADGSNPNSTTSNLLETIELLLQPRGEFYYAVHVDMEALSLDELGGNYAQWQDAPREIIDAYIGNAPRITLVQHRNVLGINETAPQAELVTVTTSPAGLAVTWRSGDTGVATVDASTGAVTGVSAGTVVITGTLSTGESASYRLTVGTPQPAPGAAVTAFELTAAGAGAWNGGVSADRVINLAADPNARTLQLTAVVIGSNLSDPAAAWAPGGPNAGWGPAAVAAAAYTVTIPGGATGSFEVTATAVDAPSRSIKITVNVDAALPASIPPPGGGTEFTDGGIVWVILKDNRPTNGTETTGGTSNGNGSVLLITKHVYSADSLSWTDYTVYYTKQGTSHHWAKYEDTTKSPQTGTLKPAMDAWYAHQTSDWLKSVSYLYTLGYESYENWPVPPGGLTVNEVSAYSAPKHAAEGATAGVVFPLSLSELTQYIGSNEESRRAADTDGTARRWILRSRGGSSIYSLRVSETGLVGVCATGDPIGFRPALWIRP